MFNAEKNQPRSPPADAMSNQVPQPKAPLSAYNLFFQLERKRILEGTDGMGRRITDQEVHDVVVEHKKKVGKRRHRKTHGKISFGELARTIANRWKVLDQDSRLILQKRAIIEKKEYAELHKAWKALQEDTDTTDVSSDSPSNENREPVQRHNVQQLVDQSVHNGTPRTIVLQNLQNLIEAELARLSNSNTTELHTTGPHNRLVPGNPTNHRHFGIAQQPSVASSSPVHRAIVAGFSSSRRTPTFSQFDWESNGYLLQNETQRHPGEFGPFNPNPAARNPPHSQLSRSNIELAASLLSRTIESLLHE
ncbi:hypothetical protein ACA910_009974 [Epithemia clementina (nom. ined.)]